MCCYRAVLSSLSYDFLNQFSNWFVFCSRLQLTKLLDRAKDKDRFNLITWCKPNPVPTCHNKYLPDVEYIVHGFSKGRLFGEMGDKSCFSLQSVGKKETGHPNEKPVSLINKLIKLGSQAKEIILDPFMGSGSTGVACAQLDRKFIGIEIEEKYFEIACGRIDEAQRQGSLFDMAPAKEMKQESLL